MIERGASMKENIKGKAKGGLARAKKLSPAERQEIAKKAAAARWSPPVGELNRILLRATHEGPLKIGDIEFRCVVLKDKTRVISATGFMKGMGMYRSGALSIRRKDEPDGAQIPLFLAYKNLKPFISNELSEVLSSPIEHLPKKGNRLQKGIKAEAIPKICDVWLRARDAGVLRGTQLLIASKCDILIRGLASVGIIALVDEATGYQKHRDHDELQRILEAYVEKEFLPWARRFGDDFYREMFRLRGWQFNPLSVKRPQLVAKLTTMITYDRLPPGVKEDIQRKNPKSEKTGRYKHKYFQYLTTDIGSPHLDKLLTLSTALMKIASTWRQFMEMYNRAVPKPGTTPPLFPMDEKEMKQ